MRLGKIPKDWSKASLIFISKKGKKDNSEGCRLASLAPSIHGRTMEEANVLGELL